MCLRCDRRNARTTECAWVEKRVDAASGPKNAPAGGLITAVAIRDAAEAMMLREVERMRAGGWSWESIGRSLGMTKQGAAQWHKRATAAAGMLDVQGAGK